jgi:hypothetical protein
MVCGGRPMSSSSFPIRSLRKVSNHLVERKEKNLLEAPA